MFKSPQLCQTRRPIRLRQDTNAPTLAHTKERVKDEALTPVCQGSAFQGVRRRKATKKEKTGDCKKKERKKESN